MEIIEEEKIVLTLRQAAEQALWDLQQWTFDHAPGCDCFTCGDTIPDLAQALGAELLPKVRLTTDEPFDVVAGKSLIKTPKNNS
jgi:hypothetical protein